MPPLISCACVAPLPHALSTALSSRREERLLFQNLSKDSSTGWFVGVFFLLYFFIFSPRDRTVACHPVPVARQQCWWVGRSPWGVLQPSLWNEDIHQMIFIGLDAKVVLNLCCITLTGSIFNVMTMAALIYKLMYNHCTAWKSCFGRCYRRTLILLDMNL